MRISAPSTRTTPTGYPLSCADVAVHTARDLSVGAPFALVVVGPWVVCGTVVPLFAVHPRMKSRAMHTHNGGLLYRYQCAMLRTSSAPTLRCRSGGAHIELGAARWPIGVTQPWLYHCVGVRVGTCVPIARAIFGQ